MTAAELIAELEKLPRQTPVRVLLTEVSWSGEFGDETMALGDADSRPLDVIRYRGNYILLESK